MNGTAVACLGNRGRRQRGAASTCPPSQTGSEEVLLARWGIKGRRKQLADPRSRPCPALQHGKPRQLAPGLPLAERGPLPTRILGRAAVIRKDPVASRKNSVSSTGRGRAGAGGLVPRTPSLLGSPDAGARSSVPTTAAEDPSPARSTGQPLLRVRLAARAVHLPAQRHLKRCFHFFLNNIFYIYFFF